MQARVRRIQARSYAEWMSFTEWRKYFSAGIDIRRASYQTKDSEDHVEGERYEDDIMYGGMFVRESWVW